MIPKERRHERILTLIVISGILFSAVCLFFLDGGQIWGINDDPDNRPSLLGKNIDGLNFTSAAGEIEPIYDDTEIVRIQFWQLSPREMLLRVITYPMAYIPLSTGKILSLLYLASGLAFLMLYRRETGRNDPDPNSRRELINRYIREHPGKNTQQIADSLGISRSSLTYYLHQLEAAGSILSVRYGGQQHFLPANIGLNEHQKNLLPLLSKEKDHLFFQTLLSHPACTRQELSAELGISVTTVVWYIQRLKRSRMLTTTKRNRSSQYSLTPEAVTAYQELVRIFPPQTDDRFPQDRDGKNR